MIVNVTRIVIMVGVLAGAGVIAPPAAGAAAQETTRTATRKVTAIYPEAAKKLHLVGKVKLTVVVAPDGKVKTVAVLGGHPVLATSATNAARQWEFAAAAKESSETLVFSFETPK